MTLEQLETKYRDPEDVYNKQTMGYLPVYEELFADRRNEELTFLEIGVQKGYSLKVWKEYFKHAQIWGLDLDPRCKRYEEDRIQIHIGDQKNTAHLKTLRIKTGKLDVVIDDGSHRAEDQLVSFLYFWKSIKPGGYYIIEDLHTAYNEDYGDGAVILDYLTSLVDIVNWYGRRPYKSLDKIRGATVKSIHFYRNLVCIKKR